MTAMPIRKNAVITMGEVPEFFLTLEKATIEARKAIASDLGRTGYTRAKQLTRNRLPSQDGGSYQRAMRWTVRHGKSGSTSTVYNNHPWAWGVEEGTSPRTVYAKRDKPMIIRQRLPPPGGKDAPYGTKYVGVYQRKDKVYHPGSRAFYIFKDSFTEAVLKSDVIVERALRKHV